MIKNYPMPKWAKHQIIRENGLIEDICEHNIGHPNATWLKEHDPDGEEAYGIHGCDGCCYKE